MLARRAVEELVASGQAQPSSLIAATFTRKAADELRGRLKRLGKAVDLLGGDQLQSAERSTKLELQLARALQEAATLRAENEALQHDVMEMIELKLQVAELRGAGAGDGA